MHLTILFTTLLASTVGTTAEPVSDSLPDSLLDSFPDSDISSIVPPDLYVAKRWSTAAFGCEPVHSTSNIDVRIPIDALLSYCKYPDTREIACNYTLNGQPYVTMVEEPCDQGQRCVEDLVNGTPNAWCVGQEKYVEWVVPNDIKTARRYQHQRTTSQNGERTVNNMYWDAESNTPKMVAKTKFLCTFEPFDRTVLDNCTIAQSPPEQVPRRGAWQISVTPGGNTGSTRIVSYEL